MKNFYHLIALLTLLLCGLQSKAQDQFLGQIMFVPYNFAPRGWADCDGQTLSIAQNQALFALLGTTYGGNGQTTFALPDASGKVIISAGQSSFGTSYTIGQTGGSDTVVLTQNELPAHNHQVIATEDSATENIPTDSVPASTKKLDKEYSSSFTDTVIMKTGSITPSGSNMPHNNQMPSLVLKCIIALEGIFPSRK